MSVFMKYEKFLNFFEISKENEMMSKINHRNAHVPSDVGWFTKSQSMQLKKVENRCSVCFIRIFFFIIEVPHFHEIDGYSIWTDVIRHELIKELLISLKSGLPQTPGMFDNGKQFESHQVLLPLTATFAGIAWLGWTGRKETLYLPLENHLF